MTEHEKTNANSRSSGSHTSRNDIEMKMRPPKHWRYSDDGEEEGDEDDGDVYDENDRTIANTIARNDNDIL